MLFSPSDSTLCFLQTKIIIFLQISFEWKIEVWVITRCLYESPWNIFSCLSLFVVCRLKKNTVLFLISIKEMKAVISLIVNKSWICYITWGSDNMWACVCPIRRWSRLCLWGRPCCCLRWERGWSCFTPCCLRALTDGRVSPKDRYPLLTSHTDLNTGLPVRTSLNWTMNWIHIENGQHFNWSVLLFFFYLCDN